MEVLHIIPCTPLPKFWLACIDSTGRITVPGFYDAVVPLSDAEKSQITLDFDQKEYQKTFGIVPTGGEQEYPPRERVWFRPTVEN